MSQITNLILFSLALIPAPWKNRPGANLGVSPVQYEQWAQMADVIQNESLKDMVVFPLDDLKLVKEAKTHRTRASKETMENLKGVQVQVEDRFKQFCDEYVYITSRYSAYQKTPKLADDFPEQEYEFDDYVANGNLIPIHILIFR
jgi:hypothetical protein